MEEECATFFVSNHMSIGWKMFQRAHVGGLPSEDHKFSRYDHSPYSRRSVVETRFQSFRGF